MDVSTLIGLLIISGLYTFQSWLSHRQNNEFFKGMFKTFKEIQESSEKVTFPMFPEDPEALAKEQDQVPFEDIDDDELHKTIENMVNPHDEEAEEAKTKEGL